MPLGGVPQVERLNVKAVCFPLRLSIIEAVLNSFMPLRA
jgi:hypothetical protein